MGETTEVTEKKKPAKEAVVKMSTPKGTTLDAVQTNIELLKAQIEEAQLQNQLELLQSKPLNVNQAVAEVIKRVDKVYKRGVNETQKYSYTMAADVMEACRMAVAEVGLTIYPLGVKNKERGGNNGQIIFGTMEYELVAPDGTTRIVEIDSAGQDYGDKGPFKFMTGALKYLFIQVFLLPQGLDPENESKDTPAPRNNGNGNGNAKNYNNNGGGQYNNGNRTGNQNGANTARQNPPANTNAGGNQNNTQAPPNQPATGAANNGQAGTTPSGKPLATAVTKTKLIKLLNHQCIEPADRKKTLDNINKISEDRALEIVEKLESLIADCEAAAQN